jgi:hypothetical protein
MDNSSSINVGHRVMSRKCKMSDKTQPNICQRLEVFVRWADLMHSVIIFCGKKERSPAWLARCLRLSCRMVPRGVPRRPLLPPKKNETGSPQMNPYSTSMVLKHSACGETLKYFFMADANLSRPKTTCWTIPTTMARLFVFYGLINHVNTMLYLYIYIF